LRYVKAFTFRRGINTTSALKRGERIMMQSPPSPECTVLVVDDDESAREAVKFLLEAEGFMVRLDLVGALRLRGIPIPAVLLTGDPNRNVRDRATAANVPVVAKWNSAEELPGRIHEMAETRVN
jgi:hypothetical protein